MMRKKNWNKMKNSKIAFAGMFVEVYEKWEWKTKISEKLSAAAEF